MKITLKMSGSTSPEPLLILLKGAENLSLNRRDKKKQDNKCVESKCVHA